MVLVCKTLSFSENLILTISLERLKESFITSLFLKMVGLIELQSTSSWSESMRMEKSVTKMGQRPSSENGQKMYLKNS